MLQRLYSVLITLALPLILLRLLVRSRHNPGYRQGWAQRLGLTTPQSDRPIIWVHAVSLGETVAVTPLIEALLEHRSEYHILFTQMTLTGAARAQTQFGDRLARQYLPYDAPWIIKPFVRRLQPRLLVLVESELWPNLLTACRAQGVPVLLANGRMNARSAKRFARAGALGSDLLSALSRVAAQTPADSGQFSALGVPQTAISLTGNLKFDQAVPQDQVALGLAWKHQFKRPTWIAASTQPTEEALILATHQQLLESHPDLLLILVPRHPERFDLVAQMLEKSPFDWVRNSLNQQPEAQHAVWLGDTMGQLFAYYAASDIAFVGASLAPIGGHSPVEPASVGVPVLMGPHVFKCQDSHDALQDVGALMPVTQDNLYITLKEALDHPNQLHLMGAAGKQWVADNQGATQRHMQLIDQLLAGQAASQSKPSKTG